MKSGFNLKERLDDLNIPSGLTRWAAIGVAIVFLVVLVCFLYISKIREMEKTNAEMDRVEVEIQETNGTWLPSKEAKERQEEVGSRLSVLIPSEKDYPELIHEIARRAMELNIQDITFKGGDKINHNVLEGEKEASPELQVLPGRDIGHFSIGLSFHSRFKDLAYFLQEIQETDRFVEIDSLVIKRSLPLISVNMVVIAYYNRQQKSDGR